MSYMKGSQPKSKIYINYQKYFYQSQQTSIERMLKNKMNQPQMSKGKVFMVYLPEKSAFWPVKVIKVLASDSKTNLPTKVKFQFFGLNEFKSKASLKKDVILATLSEDMIIQFESVYKEDQCKFGIDLCEQKKSKSLQKAIKQATVFFESQLKTPTMYHAYKEQSKKISAKTEVFKNQSPKSNFNEEIIQIHPGRNTRKGCKESEKVKSKYHLTLHKGKKSEKIIQQSNKIQNIYFPIEGYQAKSSFSNSTLEINYSNNQTLYNNRTSENKPKNKKLFGQKILNEKNSSDKVEICLQSDQTKQLNLKRGINVCFLNESIESISIPKKKIKNNERLKKQITGLGSKLIINDLNSNNLHTKRYGTVQIANNAPNNNEKCSQMKLNDLVKSSSKIPNKKTTTNGISQCFSSKSKSKSRKAQFKDEGKLQQNKQVFENQKSNSYSIKFPDRGDQRARRSKQNQKNQKKAQTLQNNKNSSTRKQSKKIVDESPKNNKSVKKANKMTKNTKNILNLEQLSSLQSSVLSKKTRSQSYSSKISSEASSAKIQNKDEVFVSKQVTTSRKKSKSVHKKSPFQAKQSINQQKNENGDLSHFVLNKIPQNPQFKNPQRYKSFVKPGKELNLQSIFQILNIGFGNNILQSIKQDQKDSFREDQKNKSILSLNAKSSKLNVSLMNLNQVNQFQKQIKTLTQGYHTTKEQINGSKNLKIDRIVEEKDENMQRESQNIKNYIQVQKCHSSHKAQAQISVIHNMTQIYSFQQLVLFIKKNKSNLQFLSKTQNQRKFEQELETSNLRDTSSNRQFMVFLQESSSFRFLIWSIEKVIAHAIFSGLVNVRELIFSKLQFPLPFKEKSTKFHQQLRNSLNFDEGFKEKNQNVKPIEKSKSIKSKKQNRVKSKVKLQQNVTNQQLSSLKSFCQHSFCHQKNQQVIKQQILNLHFLTELQIPFWQSSGLLTTYCRFIKKQIEQIIWHLIKPFPNATNLQNHAPDEAHNSQEITQRFIRLSNQYLQRINKQTHQKCFIFMFYTTLNNITKKMFLNDEKHKQNKQNQPLNQDRKLVSAIQPQHQRLDRNRILQKLNLPKYNKINKQNQQSVVHYMVETSVDQVPQTLQYIQSTSLHVSINRQHQQNIILSEACLSSESCNKLQGLKNVQSLESQFSKNTEDLADFIHNILPDLSESKYPTSYIKTKQYYSSDQQIPNQITNLQKKQSTIHGSLVKDRSESKQIQNFVVRHRKNKKFQDLNSLTQSPYVLNFNQESKKNSLFDSNSFYQDFHSPAVLYGINSRNTNSKEMMDEQSKEKSSSTFMGEEVDSLKNQILDLIDEFKLEFF